MSQKKNYVFIGATLILLLTAFSYRKHFTQELDPWLPEQLMAPEVLAKQIQNPTKEKSYIFNIGPAGSIKSSVTVGDAKEHANLEKLRQELSKVPKNAEVVIYCGCCPFVHCPNIRPAFKLLKELNFTKPKLLNLEKNLKVNWIDPGYPMAQP